MTNTTNPKTIDTKFKKHWRNRIARFTDDYIDEWTSEGDELDELHRIQDELIDEIESQLRELIQQAYAQTVKVESEPPYYWGVTAFHHNLLSALGISEEKHEQD